VTAAERRQQRWAFVHARGRLTVLQIGRWQLQDTLALSGSWALGLRNPLPKSGQKDQASKSSSLPAVIAVVTAMIMCDGNQSAHGRRRQY
jgi:hypothetical protein